MQVYEFLEKHPRLFHMAEAGSWPQIQQYGLRSTAALLDLFEVTGDERFAIESMRRPQIVTITHPLHGTAQIRDNKPLRANFLKCLPGTTPQQFFELLNRKVFFWVAPERLETLISARAYRKRAHDVLIVDAAALLARHVGQASLAAINSGSTLYPSAPPRGAETFVALEEFDWEKARRARGRANAIVELTVEYVVPDVSDVLVRVERRQNDRPAEVLWEP